MDTRHPCKHRWRTEVKNVSAIIDYNKQSLTSGDSSYAIIYNQIKFCSNPVCERVFEVNGIDLDSN